MAAADRPLVLLLRFLGCMDLLAFLAVIVPQAWIASTHRIVGLGELPSEPIVAYLTRSVSVLYGLEGSVVLFVSRDVQRYGSLITFMAIVALIHGLVMAVVDVVTGMPAWWTAVEGLGYAAIGIVVLAVQRRTLHP